MPTFDIATNQVYEFSLRIPVGNIAGTISSRKDRTLNDGGLKEAGREHRVPSQGK
jgi:hypothetical protein